MQHDRTPNLGGARSAQNPTVQQKQYEARDNQPIMIHKDFVRPIALHLGMSALVLSSISEEHERMYCLERVPEQPDSIPHVIQFNERSGMEKLDQNGITRIQPVYTSIVIGRETTPELDLDPTTSRAHARITFNESALIIEHLGATNRTVAYGAESNFISSPTV